jgi:hypothetical protein
MPYARFCTPDDERSHCGHHEIGVITEAGDYLPLNPGMKIMVFQEGKKE